MRQSYTSEEGRGKKRERSQPRATRSRDIFVALEIPMNMHSPLHIQQTRYTASMTRTNRIIFMRIILPTHFALLPFPDSRPTPSERAGLKVIWDKVPAQDQTFRVHLPPPPLSVSVHSVQSSSVSFFLLLATPENQRCQTHTEHLACTGSIYASLL